MACLDRVERRGEGEAANLERAVLVQQEVGRLQISVDDAVTVQVLHSGAELVDVALNLKFVKSLPPSKKLVQRLVLAQLEKNVDVLCILKEVLEALKEKYEPTESKMKRVSEWVGLKLQCKTEAEEGETPKEENQTNNDDNECADRDHPLSNCHQLVSVV